MVAWLPEAIVYADRPLVQEEIFSKCLSEAREGFPLLAHSLRRVEAGGTGTLAHSSLRLLAAVVSVLPLR